MLGDTIKKIRSKKNINASKVAEMLGIDKSTYSLIENNKNTDPSYNLVKNLCKVLEINPSILDELVELDQEVIDLFIKIFGTKVKVNLIQMEEILKNLYENKDNIIKIIDSNEEILEEL